jgi:hypothetical protein
MIKNLLLGILCIFLGLIAGCKRHQDASVSNGYFKTSYQDECQFIVETIVSDIAEQIYFAKFHQLPDANRFSVTAIETPESNFESPVYALQIDLDRSHAGLKARLNINGPIWSPDIYDALAQQLAQTVGLPPAGDGEGSKDTSLLGKLTDAQATTIEGENQRISAALQADFANPALHNEAAVLLGAFTLREHSGNFFEIRTPLCRLTSHLVLARYLGGSDSTDINGRLAGVMLMTLMNNQADALAALKGVPTNDAALLSWVRALHARNTDDYRPLDQLDGLSRIECIEWFQGRERSGNRDIAWSKLSDDQKKTPDFIRIANQSGYSVGVGHELLDLSLPAEYGEIESVYGLSQGEKLKKDGLAEALNRMPERCLSSGSDKQVVVHVINWGIWAGFFQRHLCQAMEKDFYLLQWQWGVPDDARAFSEKIDKTFGGLRLFPFVRRFNAVSVDDYHSAVDDGFKVTVATPQLVPAECWNYLCYSLNSKESYQPNPNPHVNEWHKHNPPPGTAYDPYPRLNHPSLVNRPDSIALLDKLHQIAPYNWDITDYIYKNKYHEKPDYAQASALFSEVLPYKPGAMSIVAATVKDQPVRYEMLLSQAAEFNPSEYFTLGNYFYDRKEEDKAMAYYEKGTVQDPDSVNASYYASWMIKYYLKKGRVEDARKEADFAADVYSARGLEAKAEFLEATGDYDGAFEWYVKNEERYDESGPVIDFCLRYKNKTGDSKFDTQLQQRMAKVFPQGIEKAALADFKSAPADGVLIEGENDIIQAAGLKRGDVIVTINGVRVHNFTQYRFERDSAAISEMDLIVWQGNGYREITANPPHHLFGVDFGNYPANR